MATTDQELVRRREERGGAAGDGCTAGVGRAPDTGCTPASGCALVALVGAGPGDPGLLTVRARDLLNRADVVVYDRLVSPATLALAAPHARLVDVGKHAGNHPVPQGQINELLVEEARRVGVGGLVVRLKGGDPYVFGRGGEEACRLREAGVPFEVVPGVTSAVAVPALAGVPVTDRRCASSFHVVTAHRRAGEPLDIDFGALVRAGGTLVFLMAVSTLGEVCAGLAAAGMDPQTPAAVIERGSLPEQRRIDGTLATIEGRARAAAVESPAVLVVGAVCALAPHLDFHSRLPLAGRRVIVTRPRDRAEGLAARLAALGARVDLVPCVETRSVPPVLLAPVVERVPEFSWVVLTSTFGVRCLMAALDAAGRDVRWLAGARVAAIGSATAAELARRGVRADLVPAVYDGAHLGVALAEAAAPGDCALLFRAAAGTADLPDALDAAGVPYEDVAAYETVLAPEPAPEGLAAALAAGAVDAVTFTSGSTVEGFAHLFPDAPSWRLVAVCLGERTAAHARAHGYQVVVAPEATVDALARAVAGVQFSA
ncbi:uroporphyrinogen-III C-methyltransferase [Olsenella profusa]|uniref:uroporphyrinogen-III C-methyltransferase n=1 Tax=Olsenella profusa TaxID=138595 RepID=UPI00195972D0